MKAASTGPASGLSDLSDPSDHVVMPRHGQAPPCPVVLDTNVQLDLWLFDDPLAAPLRAALRCGAVQALASAAMLDELASVLQRPFAMAWAIPPAAAWQAARQHVILVDQPLPADSPRCRDPDDQIYIDLAWQLPATWLLTRDRALLALARAAAARGLCIGTPAQWAAAQQSPARPVSAPACAQADQAAPGAG